MKDIIVTSRIKAKQKMLAKSTPIHFFRYFKLNVETDLLNLHKSSANI